MNVEPYELTDFGAQCHYLITSEESGFVRTVVCHRFTADGIVTLRGAVLRRMTADGQRDEVLTIAAAYARTLAQVFDLQLDDVDVLWEKVWARHQAWQQIS